DLPMPASPETSTSRPSPRSASRACSARAASDECRSSSICRFSTTRSGPRSVCRQTATGPCQDRECDTVGQHDVDEPPAEGVELNGGNEHILYLQHFLLARVTGLHAHIWVR